MKLNDAVNMRLEEARLFIESEPLLEDGEAPRWRFKYDNFNVDPTPDILLLGAYTHPKTGNNLVGGINTHYLNPNQVEKLATILPKIMGGRNLKQRYWIGRQLMPDVFTDYYRTYDSKYIRGVSQDVMFPKFGMMKTAGNWLKKKISNIFKTKKQKEIDSQPKFPDDLQNMQDRLDTVVQNLQKQDAKGIEPETPEMQRAREAFQQFQREKALQQLGIDADDLTFKKNIDNYIDTATQDVGVGEVQQDPQTTQQSKPQQRQLTPRDLGREVQDERKNNTKELLDPNNEINPDADLEESIIYYSPSKKRYVVEKFDALQTW